ncbi:MAG: replicative DNA helicase [Lachnospiraceae bacterium]|jgi:replicative DNA helicase|nr:replicative DNA helicase [Lachnospiraceae bacterium]MBQ2504531.1 replicative DNA helicase [Lachnospiraceae bacterium]MBQ2579616.1 replicative DNA helicase [Lachnospiraceae bacterium]
MDQVTVTRTMPNSLEAEQSVIGSMLMDKDAIIAAMESLQGDDFFHQSYGMLFDTIIEVYNAGEDAMDPVVLTNKLREKNAPAEISDVNFLLSLMEHVPTSINIKSYCDIVSQKAMLRKIIRMSQSIENDCYKDDEPVSDVMDRIEKEFLALLQNRGVGDFVPIRQVVLNALEKIASAAKMQGSVTGIPTGFTDLDYKMAGLQPSDLILLAARPSMGKTAFVLNIAQHVAFHENKCTAIFSLEMSKEQLVNRLFSLESRVDAQKLRTGNLQDFEWQELVEGANIIAGSPLIIDDTPGISISEMRSKCRKFKQEQGLDLIIIDYLQLMSGSGKSVSRQQEVSDISRALKGLARELNVPVIALSQLNRGVEQRDDKRPMMSDLRDSGAIEQDADVVMFIYRDDYYNKDTDRKNISEIIIAKQRNGPVGTTELAWLPQYTKFGNLEKSHRREEE